MKQEKDIKKRLFVIDILRVVCALLIYLRHSVTMYGCTYGQTLDEILIRLTSPVMTCFFLLSGFSIHYQHRREEVTEGWTRSFLKKRLISIMPSYLLVVLIWPIVYPAQFKNWLLLLPVDLMGVQTAYRTLFGILHNGGSWFVSCMLLCYVSYPVLKSVIRSSLKWTPWAVMLITDFLLIYSNIIIPKFSLDGLYSNPIARAGEFIIGVSFAEITLGNKAEDDGCFHKIRESLSPMLSILLVSIISVVIAVYCKADNETGILSYWAVPVTLLILFVSILLSCQRLEKSKILASLSSFSYQFFLMQLFLWDFTSWILQLIVINGNIAKISMSFILCLVMSLIIWKYYDKPVKRFLIRRLLH